MNVATGFQIITDRDNLLEHVFHIAGDGHFLNSELNLAVLHPVACCTTGIITGHHVQTMAHQLGHQQSAPHTPNQGGLILDPVRDIEVMHTTGVGGARQAQLAPGIGTQHIGHQLTFFDERFGIRGQAVPIERRTA
ncbi:hypothetical protein D3C76_1533610 [compost metagenome]